MTTCVDVKKAGIRNAGAKLNGSRDRLDIRGTNIGFTIDGLRVLGVPSLEAITDTPFKNGLASRSSFLNDPPSGPGSVGDRLVGNGVGPLHGMILLTGRDLATVRAMFGELVNAAGEGTWRPFFTGEGTTRPLNERGHEHFGFLDGVSQPAVPGAHRRSGPRLRNVP